MSFTIDNIKEFKANINKIDFEYQETITEIDFSYEEWHLKHSNIQLTLFINYLSDKTTVDFDLEGWDLPNVKSYSDIENLCNLLRPKK